MQIALPIHLKAKPTPVYPLSPWTVFNSICKKVKKEDERGGKETTVPHTSCYVFLRTWFLREVCFSLGSPEITPSLPCLLNTVRPFQRRINRGFFFFFQSFPVFQTTKYAKTRNAEAHRAFSLLGDDSSAHCNLHVDLDCSLKTYISLYILCISFIDPHQLTQLLQKAKIVVAEVTLCRPGQKLVI